MDPVFVLSFLLLCSSCANIALAILLKRSLKKPPKAMTMTAEDVLHDLTSGPAIVKIERIDRDGLFLRSPGR